MLLDFEEQTLATGVRKGPARSGASLIGEPERHPWKEHKPRAAQRHGNTRFPKVTESLEERGVLPKMLPNGEYETI